MPCLPITPDLTKLATEYKTAVAELEAAHLVVMSGPPRSGTVEAFAVEREKSHALHMIEIKLAATVVAALELGEK